MKNHTQCKCPACTASEQARSKINLPYRYIPDRWQNIYHLTMNLSIPIIGTILIGLSPWAFVPLLSFLAAYVVNSFLGCSACPYHHSGVKTCGCFPKSILIYKRYKPWGNIDNAVNWALVLFLIFVPTLYILAVKEDFKAFIIFLLYSALVVLLLITFSCPNCRQRDLCYLGKVTFSIRRNQRRL